MRRLLLGCAAAVALGGVAHAQTAGGGPYNPGCPLTGCTYTGTIKLGSTNIGSGNSGWQLSSTGSISGQAVGTADVLNINRGDATGTAAALVSLLNSSAANSAGNSIFWSRLTTAQTVVTAGSEAGRWTASVYGNGALRGYIQLDPAIFTLLLGTTIVSNGTAPAISSCGTSPTDANATDLAGTVTVGTAGTTTCALTWSTAKANAPTCNVTEEDGGTPPAYAISTTGLSLTFAASKTGIKVDYECIGH